MKNRDWAEWAVSAGIRAIKTVAQTAVATIGTAAVMGEVNWVMVGSAAVLSGILSLLPVVCLLLVAMVMDYITGIFVECAGNT